MKGFLLIVLLIVFSFALSAGCTSQDSGQDKSLTDESRINSETITDSSSLSETYTPKETYATSSSGLMYPGAFGRGERVYFNDASNKQYVAGESKATMSIYAESIKPSNGFYVKDMKSGEKGQIKPKSGYKYILLSITVAPTGAYSRSYISPVTSDFSLIDGQNKYFPVFEICDSPYVNIVNNYIYDQPLNEKYVFDNIGEIYVGREIFRSLNDAEGSGSVSGWLLFEVPESFTINKDTYLKMNLGNTDFYWKFFDIIAFIDVSKNPTTGDVSVRFDGGPEAQLIGSINLEVTLPDGTTNSDSIAADDNQIPVRSELTVKGSKPGEGKDHVVVYFIRRDNEKIVKFDDYMSAAVRI